MLEKRAVVVETHKGYALVKASQASGCEQCAGKGCGSSKLAQLFCSQPRLFRVDNQINAGVGDQVIISIADGAVLHGIGLVYILPLLLSLGGAVFGNTLVLQPDQRDGYAAIGALIGLMAGFALARWISSRQIRSRFQPFITGHWRE
jgi:sigma-E factor negative regulatory protein RseC